MVAVVPFTFLYFDPALEGKGAKSQRCPPHVLPLEMRLCCLRLIIPCHLLAISPLASLRDVTAHTRTRTRTHTHTHTHTHKRIPHVTHPWQQKQAIGFEEQNVDWSHFSRRRCSVVVLCNDFLCPATVCTSSWATAIFSCTGVRSE